MALAEIMRGVLRGSGPFTVEGVIPIEESLAEQSPISGAPVEPMLGAEFWAENRQQGRAAVSFGLPAWPRALKGVVDEAAFAALSGTVSLPFAPGPHRRVAVKVIDPRGNEVLAVHRLDGKTKYG